MSDPFTGGCACGALRFVATGAPLVMVDCQCLHCQKISGTGHASHVVFPRDAVTITGQAGFHEMRGDSGSIKTRAFCPGCGTWVSATFAATPGIIALSAGSLDDPARYRPQFVTYAFRARDWDHVDPALPAFERMPPG
jgi:hypothetical protein